MRSFQGREVVAIIGSKGRVGSRHGDDRYVSAFLRQKEEERDKRIPISGDWLEALNEERRGEPMNIAHYRGKI